MKPINKLFVALIMLSFAGQVFAEGNQAPTPILMDSEGKLHDLKNPANFDARFVDSSQYLKVNVVTSSGLVLHAGRQSYDHKLKIGNKESSNYDVYIQPDGSVTGQVALSKFKFPNLEAFYEASGKNPKAKFPLANFYFEVNQASSKQVAYKKLAAQLSDAMGEWKMQNNAPRAVGPYVDQYVIEGFIASITDGEVVLQSGVNELINKANDRGPNSFIRVNTGTTVVAFPGACSKVFN
ncbi:hypothetical protein [Bdellovibrio sp. HCB274]|uniref:hypothetical protein n=1 Tax=Bdellovibrio sp. HCB274 TaxID=3394361 RepID=UPI0039B5FF45